MRLFDDTIQTGDKAADPPQLIAVGRELPLGGVDNVTGTLKLEDDQLAKRIVVVADILKPNIQPCPTIATIRQHPLATAGERLNREVNVHFACKPEDWDSANFGALVTWRSM